jgi:hypothetical protein
MTPSVELHVPELQSLELVLKSTLTEISELRREVSEVRSTGSLQLNKAWYTAREACEIKGVPYHTLRKPENSHLLPAFGRGHRVMERGPLRCAYSREEVSEWLGKEESELIGEWREINQQGRAS